MSNWFKEVYLPSIFARCGTDRDMWLTAKQTAVCVRYMTEHSVSYERYQGEHYTHLYYTADWSGRKVSLNYSKLNGCGTISFGLTDAEAEELRVKHAEEQHQHEIDRIRSLKERRPERYQKKLDGIRHKIAAAEKELSEELFYNDDPESIEYFRSEIDRLNDYLTFVLSI